MPANCQIKLLRWHKWLEQQFYKTNLSPSLFLSSSLLSLSLLPLFYYHYYDHHLCHKNYYNFTVIVYLKSPFFQASFARCYFTSILFDLTLFFAHLPLFSLYSSLYMPSLSLSLFIFQSIWHSILISSSSTFIWKVFAQKHFLVGWWKVRKSVDRCGQRCV